MGSHMGLLQLRILVLSDFLQHFLQSFLLGILLKAPFEGSFKGTTGVPGLGFGVLGGSPILDFGVLGLFRLGNSPNCK